MAPKMTSRAGKEVGLQRRDGQAGFTLIELVILTAILSILFGIGVPRFRGSLEAARLQAAADTLVRAADLARKNAEAKGRMVVLSWDSGSSTVEVKWSAESPSAAATSGQDSTAVILAAKIPPEYSLRWGKPQVPFYPDASAEPCVIEIANSRGTRVFVHIDRHSARSGPDAAP
jgi:prepilin-type N-terminal cleavage/methylation domain-containing protein